MEFRFHRFVYFYLKKCHVYPRNRSVINDETEDISSDMLCLSFLVASYSYAQTNSSKAARLI